MQIFITKTARIEAAKGILWGKFYILCQYRLSSFILLLLLPLSSSTIFSLSSANCLHLLVRLVAHSAIFLFSFFYKQIYCQNVFAIFILKEKKEFGFLICDNLWICSVRKVFVSFSVHFFSCNVDALLCVLVDWFYALCVMALWIWLFKCSDMWHNSCAVRWMLGLEVFWCENVGFRGIGEIKLNMEREIEKFLLKTGYFYSKILKQAFWAFKVHILITSAC